MHFLQKKPELQFNRWSGEESIDHWTLQNSSMATKDNIGRKEQSLPKQK